MKSGKISVHSRENKTQTMRLQEGVRMYEKFPATLMYNALPVQPYKREGLWKREG